MLNKGQINAEIELISTLQLLAHAYQEISVIRMQKVRGQVTATRAFLEKLSEVFYDVKQSYKKEILEIMHKKNSGPGKFFFSTHPKNGKTAYVFVSSNARLYGDIIRKVFNLFIESVKKDPNAEVVIAGRVGKDLFDGQQSVKKPYTYFEIPDVGAGFTDLKPIVSLLFDYENVNVFYGEFLNLAKQEAKAASVSGDQPLSEDDEEAKFSFVFEPSLERVLHFFENQVFASLLKQTIHESELARFGSRARSMESALANIEKTENLLKSESRKLRKSIENKKRLEGLAGIALWT